MKPRYTDILVNAFSEVRAWKMTTLAVTGLCAMLAFALIWQAQSTPIVLVPAGFAESNGKVNVHPKDFTGTSPEYLAQTALGDLALILTWQPSNIDKQYQRFLNRTTSSLYASENVRLFADAEKNRLTGTSQSFYPEQVQVDLKNARVVVDGFLVRWEGDKEVLRRKSKFTVTYVYQKGFLHVADLELK
jgi:hypothetical protein